MKLFLRATCTLSVVLVSGACVHSQVDRTGRMRLGHGREGKAPVLAAMPAGFEEVAEVRVTAEGIATPERLERHLLRRASLLGCDGVINFRVQRDVGAAGTCVRQREPNVDHIANANAAAEPSQELMVRAAAAGPQGEALLAVLHQAQDRAPEERAWALRWYLKNYPDSPFSGDVEALFVAPTAPAAVTSSASVRPAPTVE